MSTESRRRKQFIYGGITFFALVVLAAAVVYFALPKAAPTCFDGRQNQRETGVDCGGPCISCEIKGLPAPTVRLEKIFRSGDRVLFAAEIENLNSEYGAKDLPYSVVAKDAGGATLQTIRGRTFIYALDRRYIVELFSAKPGQIAGAELVIAPSDSISWESRNTFRKPNAAVRDIAVSSDPDTRGYAVSGIITNRSEFALSRVEIIGFLYTAGGAQIAVSKTQMENMASFGERAFVLNFPAGRIEIDPSKTRVFVYAIR